MNKEITAVYDPNDSNVCYWVAWADKDNLDEQSRPLMFRVFRDNCNMRSEPITDAMSRAEAYEYLRMIELLLGAITWRQG